MSAPLGLYVHVPFCTVKCSYCDFNSYAGIEDMQSAWLEAALREITLWSPSVVEREITSIFIGGGTPSLLEGESIQRLLDHTRSRLRIAGDAEITLEANPESVQLERLQAYRAAGVNRVSMGVQSLHAAELVFLDRIHSADRAEAAFSDIRRAGFDNVNVDLIYGLPGQSLESWQDTLERVIAWRDRQDMQDRQDSGPDHISCYALTVEAGTPLAARVAAGRVIEADPDRVADIADWTAQRLSEAGYEHYETSNYARRGRQCLHNLTYWRNQEYLAIGPGAHGFVDGVRYQVVRSPRLYIDRVAAAQAEPLLVDLPSPAIEAAERVSEWDHLIDTLTSGLRLMEGVELASLPSLAERLRPTIDWAVANGLAQEHRGRLSLSKRGHAVANEVFVRLLEVEPPPDAD